MADSSRTLEVVINAKDNASNTIEGIGSSFRSMNAKMLAGSAIITGALGLVSKSMVQVGIDMESAKTSFTTFLGSGEKAGKLLKQVSDFAVKTPFDPPQVVDGTKRLLAYGIAAEDIIPTFKMLGDLSSGNREKLNQLTLAYGQVRAATKLTGAELRQFTEAGIPLLEQLGKQSGRTAGEVKEAMENGAVISFEEVQKALSSMTEEGGLFFNNMEDQSKTLGGVLSNTREQFVRFSLSVLGFTEQGDIRQGSVFYYLKQGAEQFLGLLQRVRPDVQNFFDSFMSNTPAVIGALAAITAIMIPLAASVIAATWPILALSAAVGVTAFATASLTTEFANTNQAAGWFTATLGFLFPQMDLLVSKNAEVAWATQQNEQAQRNLTQAIEDVRYAETLLIDKKIALEAANLRVEKTQMSYDEALKRYGPTNIKTRDLELQLRKAKNDVEIADKQVWDQIDSNNKLIKEQYMPTQKAAEKANENLKTSNEKTANSFDRIKDAIGGALSKLGEWLSKPINVEGIGKGFQHGGFVQGAFNQAVPAVLHGGERVTPRMGVDVNGGGGGGNNVSINITGSFQLDSNSRMNEFADMVIEKLNRQNELAGKGVSV